uniref:Uncharacterized protein n=1 Tax=Tanacetum cinerariifolium TaxID=118510 RepID=A0A6L2K767_TANCI|nr:hypothetical protein [Tanacetum cinerariifolium]
MPPQGSRTPRFCEGGCCVADFQCCFVVRVLAFVDASFLGGFSCCWCQRTTILVGDEMLDFQVVADVRSWVEVHPVCNMGPTLFGVGDEVYEVLLFDVYFDGAFRSEGDFTLGASEGVLSSRLSLFKDSRFTYTGDHMRILAVILLKQVKEVFDKLVMVVVVCG